ncbi:MAG: 2,3-bisphosphoglycerate-independent phosphoglycerate mutase, partial [Alphaproteobacteria bacterium]|nr:2,3-bisphosphoglycerate-independent phosphoglycerate mutase [Alphaproteobacteria bacterium]
MERSARRRPVVLCVLDGWGHREAREDNAIARARTPVFSVLWRDHPHALLDAAAGAVGLPGGQMGNSEVGHLTIGAGRVVLQDMPRIDAAIADGSLDANPVLADLIARLTATGGACHLMGLLSPGGVHAHQNHIVALARLVGARGVPLWLHAFLDGRDTPPRSAEAYAAAVLQALPGVRVGSVAGRYYAMDRDNRWDQVAKAYATLALGEGERMPDLPSAIRAAYAAGESDEFVVPRPLADYLGMSGSDGLLMANFRADRVREILAAILDPDFTGFPRARRPRLAAAVGMVSYSEALDRRIAPLFPPLDLHHTLGELVAAAGLRQLRIAETEKYAHVTFFFNGGQETSFPGEDRVLIPSPRVATYDLRPEMSAVEV